MAARAFAYCLKIDEAKDQRSLQQGIERVLLNRLLQHGETLLPPTYFIQSFREVGVDR